MTEAKDIKKGAYIRYNNEILKVIRKEVVACGTHSHSKTKVFAQGLFTKGEKSFNLSHSDSVEELDIMRKEGQVISKGQGKLQVMDIQSFETFDAEADKELMEQINEGDAVTFINIEGRNVVLDIR